MRDSLYFGAGPAVLPEAVLEQAQRELLNYKQSGLSVLELSHRSEEFIHIQEQAESLLRELMQVPDHYAVLFMHGGATSQYSMLPLNFLSEAESADYICTGFWSRKACNEAKRFAAINEVNAFVEIKQELSILPTNTWNLKANSKYIHYCDNETITGLAFNAIPDVQNKPLICDMTSSILTRPIDVSKFGLIYASAQKNLGIAGLGVVIVNKELLQINNASVPHLYNYKLCAEYESLLNTPPTFAIYILNLMLNWLKTEATIETVFSQVDLNASRMYEVLDASNLYKNRVRKEFRSKINIVFDIEDKEMQERFISQAEQNNLLGLRGHKVVGGIRASFYNAMPPMGVQRLVDFMQDFEQQNKIN